MYVYMHIIYIILRYRVFEFSISIYDNDKFGAIGNQVMIASKDARFLKFYMETYRNNYRNDNW